MFISRRRGSFLVLLCIAWRSSACKKSPKRDQASSYQIIASDLDHFWQAYDTLKGAEDSVAVFQKLYLDKASSAFKKFLALRHFTAAQ